MWYTDITKAITPKYKIKISKYLKENCVREKSSQLHMHPGPQCKTWNADTVGKQNENMLQHTGTLRIFLHRT